jgi:hypothetical protein
VLSYTGSLTGGTANLALPAAPPTTAARLRDTTNGVITLAFGSESRTDRRPPTKMVVNATANWARATRSSPARRGDLRRHRRGTIAVPAPYPLVDHRRQHTPTTPSRWPRRDLIAGAAASPSAAPAPSLGGTNTFTAASRRGRHLKAAPAPILRQRHTKNTVANGATLDVQQRMGRQPRLQRCDRRRRRDAPA